MSLEAIYYIGQTVAAVALVASLIFVGLQVRQNTQAQHAAAQETFHAHKIAHMSLLIANKDVADIFRKGLKGRANLDASERWRFAALVQQEFDIGMTVHRNRDAFADIALRELMSFLVTKPGVIEWWAEGRALYPKSFQDTVDGWIAEAGTQDYARETSKTDA